MESVVKRQLQSVLLGEAQIYKNIVILPLIASTDGTIQYRTLGEALSAKNLAITEVSIGGSVPELMVVNRGHESVLLIDGEELAGARQNRVLNTSILLKEVSETKIPVSCTEQGRWAYTSKVFSESGHVMAYKSRSRKTNSVQFCLESSGKHLSDQSEVWSGIAELHHAACLSTPTHAMSDVYKAREADLSHCDEIFKPVANQIGLLAFIDGEPAGVDMVSLTAAYAKLHHKLVRSYTLEALLSVRKPGPASIRAEGQAEADPDPALRAQFSSRAKAFLEEIATAEESHFPSVGHGTDFRYRRVTPRRADTDSTAAHPAVFTSHSIAGTALVHNNEVIHAAFFRLDDSDQRFHKEHSGSRNRHFRT